MASPICSADAPLELLSLLLLPLSLLLPLLLLPPLLPLSLLLLLSELSESSPFSQTIEQFGFGHSVALGAEH
jgi:hypothetical protein